MKTKILQAILAVGLTLGPAAALAHGNEPGGHHHDAPAKKHGEGAHHHDSPHGGEVVDLGDIHAEVVFGAGALNVYFFDPDMKAIPAPASGKVTLVVGKDVKKAELTSNGDHLTAPVGTPAAGKAKAVVQTTVGGKARVIQAERKDGTKADAIPFHDHRSLHGGLVGMSGDDHAELLAESGGVYKLWFSDAWRKPIAKGTKATLVVTAADGRKETIALQGPDAEGMLVGKGAPMDGVSRKVELDGFASGYPFRFPFEIRSAAQAEAGKAIELAVTEQGFVPADIEVEAGQPVRLRITRRTEHTCAKDIEVPGFVGKTELPMGQPVEIAFTPARAGKLRYGCSMGRMVGGTIAVN